MDATAPRICGIDEAGRGPIAGPVTAAAVILLLMYVVNALGNISSAMKPFRRFSLFYHYGSAIEHGVAWTSFLVTLAIALGFMALAIVAFNRRDIYT